VAALKLLQLAPLCPDQWENGLEESGQFLPSIGVGPWRGFIGPTASEFGYMSFKERVGFNVMAGPGPGYLNVGLMKPRRGFTPIEGNEKTGVGKS
jgi:hypothetical protein